jgi:CRP-like cAMP-binding protein
MHPVLRKLSNFAPFSDDEQRHIEQLFSRTQKVAEREVIVWEDDKPVDLIFLLEGMAQRSKVLHNGRRQILAIMVPGDPCDRGVTLLERRDHSLVALTEGTIARVDGETLESLLAENEKMRDAFQWASLVEEAIAREWITNVGQRDAIERAAHLFCELFYKLSAVGLTEGLSYRLPLIQRDLADCLGISDVHANRVLQAMRSENLIAFGDKRLTVLDLPRLERRAGFDPLYLHLGAKYRGLKR